jgi:rare lipoprotein A
VQVENLDNGRSAIVKVNDRGPFVHDRVIDLSYGAAVVLGVKNAGTARVRVTAIDFIDGQPMLDGRLLATAETQAAPRRERLPAAQPIRASAPVLVPAKLESSAAAAVPAASAPISATTVTPAAAPVAAAAPPAPLRPAPVASVERAYLQFGAFAERDRAYALRSKISQQAEVSGVHVLRHWRNGNPLYRVRMGPFGSESDLQTAQLAMQRAGVAQYRVVRE